MINFDKNSILSALGAIVLSVTCVAAAVGPARAVETAPAASVQVRA